MSRVQLVEVWGGARDGALIQVGVDEGEPLPAAVLGTQTGALLRLIDTPQGPKYTPLDIAERPDHRT